jgi:hypothetical protein
MNNRELKYITVLVDLMINGYCKPEADLFVFNYYAG